IPVWEPGRTIDLLRDIEEWNLVGRTGGRLAAPGMGKPIADVLQSRGGAQFAWTREYLVNNIRCGLTSSTMDDSSDEYRRSIVLLSLYDRIAPIRSTPQFQRSELLRRDARWLDMSDVVAAGGLAIFAVARDVPLPAPLLVEGETPEGRGDIIYQAVLPIERPISIDTESEEESGEGSAAGPSDAE